LLRYHQEKGEKGVGIGKKGRKGKEFACKEKGGGKDVGRGNVERGESGGPGPRKREGEVVTYGEKKWG